MHVADDALTSTAFAATAKCARSALAGALENSLDVALICVAARGLELRLEGLVEPDVLTDNVVLSVAAASVVVVLSVDDVETMSEVVVLVVDDVEAMTAAVVFGFVVVVLVDDVEAVLMYNWSFEPPAAHTESDVLRFVWLRRPQL